MSLIITMALIPDGINSLKELPEGFEPTPLGTKDEVIAFLKTLFPDANYNDPTWINVSTSTVSEILVDKKDPVITVGFRNPSFSLIKEVYELKGWRGINPSDSSIIPPFIPPEQYGFE